MAPLHLDANWNPTCRRPLATVLAFEAAHAHRDPTSAPMNSAAFTFCATNSTFAKMHIRTSVTQIAASLPAHALDTLMQVIADLFSGTHSTRGVALRDVVLEALLLFPTLVLGPRRLGASSSSVRTEVAARLDLWRREDLYKLAKRAKALASQRPLVKRNKSAQAARRATRLMRKKQFARAASLASNLGVADATEDTLESLRTLFPKSSGVA